MRIGRKLLWLLLMVLTLVLLMPSVSVVAQGKFELILNPLPGAYYREITPGEETNLYFEIRNIGSQTISGIMLSTDIPKGWNATLNPKSIDSLSAGNSQTIIMSVTAPPETERDDYTLLVIAEASQARTASSIVVRVDKSPSFWVWIGAGLVVLIIATFVIIFLRSGRD